MSPSILETRSFDDDDGRPTPPIQSAPPARGPSVAPPRAPTVGPRWRPGDRVADGAFEVMSCLGRGGMGEVYEARDLALSRVVAIKVLRDGIAPGVLQFEARALAACRHPGVATVHSLGRDGDLEFLVMERIYGVTLSGLIAQRQQSGSPLTVDEALDILVGISEALAAIHETGVAHRDLKPDNVLLAPRGRVVIVDFGIVAPECHRDRDAPLAGTPYYMAPETIAADVSTGEGHLVDLYALGVVAYQLLTGEVPFVGESPMEVLSQHLVNTAPDVLDARADVPVELALLLADLLQKNPDERPHSIEAVLWRLRALRGEPERRARAKRLRVLLADGDPNALRLAELVVRRVAVDAEIEAVADGVAALQAATQRAPDLLVVDLDLPRMNGLEVTLALRGTRALDRTTIVVVGERAGPHDVAVMREAGAAHFLKKGPSYEAALAAAVRGLRASR